MAVAVAALASACLCVSAASGAVRPGHYCSRDELQTSSGDDLGEASADAKIERAGSSLTLSFSNSMPDSGQGLETGPVRLHPMANGAFSFRFTDNWGAKAAGTLKPTRTGIRIDIDRTGKAADDWGDNAGRNYGRTDLRPAPCRSAQ
jgi:hypothetical protein